MVGCLDGIKKKKGSSFLWETVGWFQNGLFFWQVLYPSRWGRPQPVLIPPPNGKFWETQAFSTHEGALPGLGVGVLLCCALCGASWVFSPPFHSQPSLGSLSLFLPPGFSWWLRVLVPSFSVLFSAFRGPFSVPPASVGGPPLSHGRPRPWSSRAALLLQVSLPRWVALFPQHVALSFVFRSSLPVWLRGLGALPLAASGRGLLSLFWARVVPKSSQVSLTVIDKEF
ncbi:hypothetical protein DSO57_1027567 [Entomophthora muscae]|uniref:Uncharacterized protein n=1 Tax=Entomophthora muscae TaxID=34485 RepID=A0ACC2U0A6_9FUNG|nr:hypothetical protein DSO57_1027567 [Entomophthora muscae]